MTLSVFMSRFKLGGIIGCGFVVLLYSGMAFAPYSDYYSNKQRGISARDMTLQHGGTYSQAGRAYMNNRYGYGTGKNTDVYSPYYPTNPGFTYQQVPGTLQFNQQQHMTPEQTQEFNRRMKQSQELIDQINNDPMIWR